MMKKIIHLLNNFKLEKRDIFLVLFNVVAVFIMATLQRMHLGTPHVIASIFSLGGSFFNR